VLEGPETLAFGFSYILEHKSILSAVSQDNDSGYLSSWACRAYHRMLQRVGGYCYRRMPRRGWRYLHCMRWPLNGDSSRQLWPRPAYLIVTAKLLLACLACQAGSPWKEGWKRVRVTIPSWHCHRPSLGARLQSMSLICILVWMHVASATEGSQPRWGSGDSFHPAHRDYILLITTCRLFCLTFVHTNCN